MVPAMTCNVDGPGPSASTGHAYTPRVFGLPLDGVRVVDLTTVVSGPYGTLLLSDFGADVVKVEAPGGDVARDLGPRAHDGMAAVYLACNRGKRSVVLDLHTDDGRARLAQLAAASDVVVHNMRRDAALRCGADPDTLRTVNPSLVHCAIVGFGPDGPYADLPAYDDTVQAVAGIAGAQSWMHGEPTYTANAVADKVAGMAAAFAIAAALRKRELDGRGATIEVPMAELLASFGLVEHLWGRVFVPPRGDTGYPRISSPFRRPFPTKDGYLAAVVYTDRNWATFFAMIGRPELADDPRYATLHSRTQHLEELYALVAEHLATDTTAAWFERFREAAIPAARYNAVDDMFDDEHFRAVGLFEEVDHPTEGRLLQCVTPITIDGERVGTDTPAPELGADTDAVFEGLSRPR
jgi:crotonobetainyl-CoA:carnitine CoA-transferase CaiB-like acyl-CoA transferase